MMKQTNLETSKKTRKKKEKEKEGHMVHAVPPKYMGCVFHAREQVATTDGQDMIRDIINHLSHGYVCVCVMLRGEIWAG